MRLLTSLAAGIFASTPVPTKSAAQTPVRYKTYGRGPGPFLGSPISVDKSGQGSDPIAALRQGYLDRLTDRYQVIVMDYLLTGARRGPL